MPSKDLNIKIENLLAKLEIKSNSFASTYIKLLKNIYNSEAIFWRIL